MMSAILGVHDGHDAGAALITEDRIHAINEERLTRKKYCRGFPERSINKTLEISNIDLEEIEKVAVAGIYRRRKRLLQLKNGIEKVFSRKTPEIVTVPHHLAHASGAYFTSGWDGSIVLTIDAAGDGLSSGVYLGFEDRLTKIAESSYLDSAGDFYASITEMLGFLSMRHEGKIMALSAYHEGSELIDFSDCIEINGLSFKNYLEKTGSESMKMLSKKVDLSLNKKDEYKEVLRKKKKDHEFWQRAVKIAASAQKHLENMIDELCTNIKKEKSIPDSFKDKICFSGGVAQNVKVNKIIKENFEDVYVFPHMGDGGLALGAATHLNSGVKWDKNGKNRYKWDWKKDLKNVYLGPKYELEKVKGKIEKRDDLGLEFLKRSIRYDKISTLLKEENIIGIFQDEMEYGPRALGNRSIIADPSKKMVKERLNKKLGREPFQPFSPTILNEYNDTYLRNSYLNRFMTMSFDVTEKGKEDLYSAIHVDGTCRPQIIGKNDNERYHKMIKNFEQKTGIGGVLNTSFNLHGDPIVCNPIEALDSFEKIGLDALAIGKYLIVRK